MLPSGSRVVPPALDTPGNGLEAPEEIGVERAALIRRLVLRRHGDLQRQQVVGPEAGIDRQHREEAAQQQAGAEREHHRERDLRHDERGAQTALPAA